MPQVQLPFFSEEFTPINCDLGFQRKDQLVVYFHGSLPVFQHQAGDLAAFRRFTSQLVINGTASHEEIARAFNLPLGTVKRYVDLSRRTGLKSFLADS